MQMNDFVVRFAGEGGQGVVTSAEGLAQASTQAGYHALTYATFPSQILEARLGRRRGSVRNRS